MSSERQIKNLMKVGAWIALPGLMCPFFWMSVFNGNSWFETRV